MTGRPSDHFASFLITKVHVLRSSEELQDSATAGTSVSVAGSNSVSPSNTARTRSVSGGDAAFAGSIVVGSLPLLHRNSERTGGFVSAKYGSGFGPCSSVHALEPRRIVIAINNTGAVFPENLRKSLIRVESFIFN